MGNQTIKVGSSVPAEAVARRAFYLAYQACGGPMGMGIFQARSDVTEDHVWQNVCTNADYTFSPVPNKDITEGAAPDTDVDVYGDYVFGRMMKLGIRYNTAQGTIKIRDDATETPRRACQAWALKYPTYRSLVDAAIATITAQLLANGDTSKG